MNLYQLLLLPTGYLPWTHRLFMLVMMTMSTMKASNIDHNKSINEQRNSSNHVSKQTIDILLIDPLEGLPDTSHSKKPGHCPKDDNGILRKPGTCKQQCQHDTHCHDNMKCCYNGCTFVCTSPTANVRPGSCPSAQYKLKCETRKDICRTDDECHGKLKCCFDGCRHVCFEPYSTKERPGFCPIKLQTETQPPCNDQCHADMDCRDKISKCCHIGCGRVCVTPNFNVKWGQCPRSKLEIQHISTDLCNSIGNIGSPRDECRNDMDCVGTKKCCLLNCGRKCVDLFEMTRPGQCPRAVNETKEKQKKVLCQSDVECILEEKCCGERNRRTCRQSFLSKTGCKSLIDQQSYKEADSWYEDECTQCRCHGNQVRCVSLTCADGIPLLEGCVQRKIKGRCCSEIICLDKKISGNGTCTSRSTGSSHANNERWYMDKCTMCTCSNGSVSCQSLVCERKPPTGCIFIDSQTQCCPTISCNSDCINGKGEQHSVGDHWQESECMTCQCHQNQSKECQVMQCPTLKTREVGHVGNCLEYKAPGSCCPEVRCSSSPEADCSVTPLRRSGDRWMKNACISCSCTDGVITCHPQVCPSIADEDRNRCFTIEPPDSQCCGDIVCPMQKKGGCQDNGAWYYNNEIWQRSECVTCVCKNQSVQCYRMACEQPHPGCIAEYDQRKCCPNIRCPAERQMYCNDSGVRHIDGDSWYRDPCRQCHCRGDHITCTIRRCPIVIPIAGCSLVHHKDECCPTISCRPPMSSCSRSMDGFIAHGSSWLIDNGCTICHCSHGLIECLPSECIAAPRGCYLQPSTNDRHSCCPNIICPAKLGICPPIIPLLGNATKTQCQNQCIVDNDCPLEKKCCSQGCHMLCVAPVEIDCFDSKGRQRFSGDSWYGHGLCEICHCTFDKKTSCRNLSDNCPPVPDGCEEISTHGQCCPDLDCPAVSDEETVRSECVYNNEMYDHGERWMNGSCTQCQCIKGLVTCEQLIQCPLQPINCRLQHHENACCPEVACREIQSCVLNDTIVMLDGESWQIDACTNCRCDKGQSWCTTKTCPVLTDVSQNQCKRVFVSGQCCPNIVCQPQSKNKGLSSSNNATCVTAGNGQRFNNGDVWSDGACTTCACANGHVSCEKIVCPVVAGANCRFQRIKGQCCPNVFCREEHSCLYKGVKYLNGERWTLTQCQYCECFNGNTVCHETHCPTPPANCETRTTDGVCCPDIVCQRIMSDYDPKRCQDLQGDIHGHGDTWSSNSGCTMCQCDNGRVYCQRKTCPPFVYRPGCIQVQYADVCCPDVVCGNSKVGRCPSQKNASNSEVLCVDECYHDKDCVGIKKCCTNGCGRVCLVPRWNIGEQSNTKASKIGVCPLPRTHLKCSHRMHDCQNDFDCQFTSKCCFNGCYNQCQVPTIDTKCSSDQPRALCFHDPCKNVECAGQSGKKDLLCVVRKCGSCRAEFYDANGKLADCDSKHVTDGGDVTAKVNSNSTDCKRADENAVWDVTPCTVCTCVDGIKRCWMKSCSPVPIGCFAVPEPRLCCPKVVCPYETRCAANETSDARWKIDECTQCQCLNRVPSCFSTTCRMPSSSSIKLLNLKNKTNASCCPTHRQLGCFDNNATQRPEGSIWNPDPCMKCLCVKNVSSCVVTECPLPGHGCYERRINQNKCCPDIICPEDTTPCSHRLKELILQKSPSNGHWPRCDDSGLYQPTQCNSLTGYCWCSNPWGEVINETMVKFSYPSCIYRPCFDHVSSMKHHRRDTSKFVPGCTLDGFYRPRQCHFGECWCVDKYGTELPNSRSNEKQSVACACLDPTKGLYRLHGEVFGDSKCHRCICQDGLVRCRTKHCQSLQLHDECKQLRLVEQCCPLYTCANGCVDSGGLSHKFNETWEEGNCLVCQCNQVAGLQCHRKICPSIMPLQEGCQNVPRRNSCCGTIACHNSGQ